MEAKKKQVLMTSLTDFKSLQEDRVKRYHLWGEDHKRYLATGPNYDLEMYKRCVKETTENFQKTSDAIIKVIAALNGLDCKDSTELAAHIQRVSWRKRSPNRPDLV